MKGNYLFPTPGQMWSLSTNSNVKGLYFKENSGVLWTRSTALDGKWEKLPKMLPAQLPFLEHDPESFIDFDSGVSAVLSEEGKPGRFLIHDPRVGDVVAEGFCAPGDTTALELICSNNIQLPPSMPLSSRARILKSRVFYFLYIPGSHELHTLNIADRAGLSLIYLNPKGTGVWTTSHGEAIWRSAPGRKDLRLWPPQGGPEKAEFEGR
jgi:hypothetical protein